MGEVSWRRDGWVAVMAVAVELREVLEEDGEGGGRRFDVREEAG